VGPGPEASLVPPLRDSLEQQGPLPPALRLALRQQEQELRPPEVQALPQQVLMLLARRRLAERAQQQPLELPEPALRPLERRRESQPALA
jgi:hypothetical protein